MKMAVSVLFLFGVVIGVATFIENDYGTQTARALVYNARWFEFFLLYFIILLVYNMFKFKSYKNRPSVFLFHFSFLVIAIGAALTRFAGYEGIMHIRQGDTSYQITSDLQTIQIGLESGGQQAFYEKPLYLSSMTTNHLSDTFKLGDQKIDISLTNYLPNAQKKVIDNPKGTKIIALKLATSGMDGEMVYLSGGESYDAGTFVISYDVNISGDKPQLNLSDKDGNMTMTTAFSVDYMKMDDQSSGTLGAGVNPFLARHLYRFGENAVVLREVREKSIVRYETDGLKPISGQPELISLRFRSGGETKEIDLLGVKGMVGKPKTVEIGGVKVTASYGAKVISLPFGLELVKFDLERYPGSMTPSSYASDVVLIDKAEGIREPHRIYMNHVLDHRGYRFFQSSYDTDENGTILSVNHDPGTLPTYLGYLLLTIGMLWSLFAPNGRFQQLLKGARKLQHGAVTLAAVILLGFAGAPLYAQSPDTDSKTIGILKKYDKVHAQKFGSLVVQDHQGRMKPIDTLAYEVVAKITGKTSVLGLDPNQIMLGMITQPQAHQSVPFIKIGHPKIALKLGLSEKTKMARFSDFFEKQNGYKLFKEVSEATRKKTLDQSQYDKELIKIDERVNVAYMVYMGTLLNIYPKPNDHNNKWLSPVEAIDSFPGKESQMVQLIMQSYFQSIGEGIDTGNWSKADEALDIISKYQNFYGSEVIPSPSHIEMEIDYNRLGLFGRLVPFYLFVGLVLLILAFVHVLRPGFSMKWVMRIALTLLVIGFAVHIMGLGMRWYVSGHAPWSNAYESIVFIAASTVMAGLLLAKESPIALAGTALLAGLTMAVAHMSFINPEITNLVPVLKSYWLMIHVATIISGDGFLGLGSVLSLFVLILFALRKGEHANIDRSIKELTKLAEMSLIIGLILMTVGNFLGGVWANESWGRYWGWDPKETWAAVTILIYAAVLHLRFIPALKSIYLFNVASTWAYSTVLMTYFGVNYYLSGLHSYAAGDPVPIPVWVYYAIAGLFMVTLLAARNRKPA
jgi:cytochrome c-type biogenesis protein CcsB